VSERPHLDFAHEGDNMDQQSQQPGVEPSASPPADDALAVLRRPAIRLMLAISLAAGAGVGGFVIANAATASPSPSASPSTSAAPTHNCPNMGSNM
jgi:hypothetical protein